MSKIDVYQMLYEMTILKLHWLFLLASDNHFWVESLISDYQGSVYTLSFIDASEIYIDRRV